MPRHSPRYLPEHIASSPASGRGAYPQATASPLRHFAPDGTYPTSSYHPTTSRPFYIKVSDLGIDPAYMEPSPSPPAPRVAAYPYIPHNPTLAELEACSNRMRSVRFRGSPENRYGPSSGDTYSSATGGGMTPGKQSYPSSPELADESNQSNNESEESSGPETPYTPRTGLWQDQARPAFVPPRSFQPVPMAAPPSTPAVVSAPAPNVNEEVNYPSGLPVTSEGSDSNSNASSTDRAFAYAAVEEIIYELNSCVLKFKMPHNLQFVAPKDGEALPRLPYIGGNKALIHHKQGLDALLDRLDKIESRGDAEIRKTRKQAVEAVKQSLRELNRQQSMAWFNQQYEQRQN